MSNNPSEIDPTYDEKHKRPELPYGQAYCYDCKNPKAITSMDEINGHLVCQKCQNDRKSNKKGKARK